MGRTELCRLCRDRHNRHAYATHQLAGGLSVERLQRLMGHRSIQTTLRYVHWLPSASEGEGALDLIAQLGVDHG
ncbi:tyrosine-type recombinase/integrase [uncultured Thiodictyon sp.]|uniref:tyrosine-type recombinase/integrase n=1 Tax=uncultured Thiodictyon sp. TaxID=1846217 RepID=UPI003457D906